MRSQRPHFRDITQDIKNSTKLSFFLIARVSFSNLDQWVEY